MTGKITEIFESVQGEGIYVGQKQIFVRFSGCNMKCKFCDTNTDKFSFLDSQDVYERFKLDFPQCKFVSYTGGEPLVQKEFLKELLVLTKEDRFKNYLETNGTLPYELAEVIDLLDVVAMDLKLPSSTQDKPYWQEHRKFLEIASKKEVFLKAIICQSTIDEDIEEAINIIREIKKDAVLVLQPNSVESSRDMNMKLDGFCQLAKNKNVKVCVIPQMHKIWGVK